jgi:type IV pilus assembly protein PilC
MPRFAFTAIDDRGREYRGEDEAVSEAVLEARLRKVGHWVARMSEVRPILRRSGLYGIRAIRVPRRPLAEFFLQMSMQLRAGIPLMTALASEAGESSHPGLRRVVTDLHDRVQAGEALSESMQAHPRAFPKLCVNLVRAGEASGSLAETLNRIRLHLEWQDRIIADVRQALVYPLFVLGCAVAFVFLVFTFLVPRFAKLLTELNVPLPLLTQIVTQTSDFFVHHAAALAAALVGGTTFFWAGIRFSPGVRYWMDRLRLALPVFGPLCRMIGLARFAQNLAVMYQAGIALPDSLTLVSGLTGSRVLELAILDLRKAVNEGRQMHTAMGAHPVFSPLVRQMVSVGETTGSLGTALENVSAYYNEVLPRQIKRLFSVIEPVMIISLVFFVGLIALSIFLPILSLLNIR